MTGAGITPREPITATPEELAISGIRYQSDDLFTGHSVAINRTPVHFGLVRLTAGNQPFWRRYRASAGRVADILNRLAKRLERPDVRLDPNAVADEHGWSRGEFDRVADVMRRHAYGRKKVFRSVKGGVTGIEWLLDEDFAGTDDRFVAYAAREPIWPEPPGKSLSTSARPADLIREHQARYSALLLTVGVATERGMPTVTHFGIFRNPSAFLDPEPVYRGLAMQLHGFAATVSLHALSGKVYMITNPMPRMTEILSGSVAQEDIYIADSEANARGYINRNLPPGVTPIEHDRRISFAGFTLGSRPTLVKLEALARYYHPAEPDSERSQ